MPRLVEPAVSAWWVLIRRILVKLSRSLPNGLGAAAALAVCFTPLAACSMRSGLSPVELGAVPSSDPTVIALAEFADRVDEYGQLHRAAAGSVPPLRAGLSATEVFSRERLLADAIRAMRSHARQGDIFTVEVAPTLRGIVQAYLDSPEGAAARDTVATENPAIETPLTPVVLTVNGAYEPAASYSTMPPTLLMRLPRLPREVEYRFVGKNLLLRDTTANIIVDYMFDVAP